MRRMNCRRILFVSILAASTAGWAQDQPLPAGQTLTVEEAQQEAVERSPFYHQAQAAEREASWGQFEALSQGFLPHVSIGGKYFMSEKYGQEMIAFPGSGSIPFIENFPVATLALDAQYDLFDGLQNIHNLNAANHRHEAAKILSDWAEFQLRENLRLAFCQAMAAKKISDMADQNVKTLEDHLRIVNDQLENGQATKYDVLRVEVQLSEAKTDQISAHDNVILTRENLARAMGLKKDDRPLSGELPVLDAAAIMADVQTVDFKDRPDLKAKELQAQAALDQSAAAHSFWFPRISLMGECQWYDAQDYSSLNPPVITNSGNFNNSYFIGAAATWDILDGGLSVAKANEASEKAKESKDDLEASQLDAPYNYDLWKRRLVSNVAIYQAKLTDIDKAQESVRLATLGFKAGTRTTTDVLDAELDLFRASAGVVQAQVSAIEALVNLEMAVGKRIGHE